MTFDDYSKLQGRAKEVGIDNCPALTQLLDLLQAKHKVQQHYKAYMQDMNDWEKNCAKIVEAIILTKEMENTK